MKTVAFTARSPEYASKCLVEMLRLSNKYPKGVARRYLGDDLTGPWDIAVVSNVKNLVDINVFDLSSAILIDITPTDSLKLIWSTVEGLAKQHGLI